MHTNVVGTTLVIAQDMTEKLPSLTMAPARMCHFVPALYMYFEPRGPTFPKNRDGSRVARGRGEYRYPREDAKHAARNAKAAYAKAMIRDVTQGGGGDGKGGEEVADDAPRYRWVHHRRQVFRSHPARSVSCLFVRTHAICATACSPKLLTSKPFDTQPLHVLSCHCTCFT